MKPGVEFRSDRAPGSAFGGPAESDVGRCSQELIAVLARLEGLHTQLAELIDAKIERMGRCDVAGMSECRSSEQALIGRIGEQEGLRRSLTDRIGRGYGMSPQRARRLTASQLAEKLASSQGEELLRLAGRVQALATRIVRRNRVAGQLGSGILAHMETILSAMTGPGEQSGAYCPHGQVLGPAPRRLFETVG